MGARDENWGAQVSTRIAFFITGIGFSSLAPMVPFIKSRMHLDERTLGFLLLCVGIGSILILPFGGALAGRFGCRKTIFVAALALCASMPILALADNIPEIAFALLLMGAGGGIVDVVVNIQAVIVEEASKRPMMSGFHGMFSIGGIAGAGGISVLLSLGMTPFFSQSLVATACVVMLVMVAKDLLPYSRTAVGEKVPVFAFPRGKVLLFGILCFIIFMAEGSITDWSGVLLTSYRSVEPAQAGLGYVAFAAMMTLNRLTGDIVVEKVGRRRVMFLGCIIGAAGFVIAAFSPHWLLSIAGFGMVGIGLANVVPILFTASGKQDDMPANLALSSVTTLGYIGFLVGPPLIGFIAHSTSLLVSLVLLGALCFGVALFANRVAPV